jgi:prophage DNA circulation protein
LISSLADCQHNVDVSFGERLRKCSVAGIPVVHRTSSKLAGRPHAIHASATNDYAEVESIGPDFDMQARSLEVKLAERSSFEYVHPIWGPLDVVLRSPARFQDRPGGVVNKCVVSLELKRAAIITPTVPAYSPTVVAAQVASAQDALDADFVVNVAPNNFGFADLIHEFAGKIIDAADFVGGINGAVAGKLSVVNSLTAAIKELERNVNTLVHTPDLIRSSLSALVFSAGNLMKTASQHEPALSPSRAIREQAQRRMERLGTNLAGNERPQDIVRPSDASEALVSGILASLTITLDVSSIPTGEDQTPQRAAQLQATKALERWTRATLGLQLSRSLVDAPWESTKQVRRAAQAVRDSLASIRSDPGHSPATISALRGAMLAMATFFDSQVAKLPQVRMVEVKRTRSLVLLAHDIFGDARLHTRLERRNSESISDAGRLNLGAQLEVLE